jgi:deferrochelatase/peroxidase EfeB
MKNENRIKEISDIRIAIDAIKIENDIERYVQKKYSGKALISVLLATMSFSSRIWEELELHSESEDERELTKVMMDTFIQFVYKKRTEYRKGDYIV